MEKDCKSVGLAFAGSSPARPTLTYDGAIMMLQPVPLRIITPIVWLEFPDWLTPAQASYLSGHDADTVLWLIEDGAVETRCDGDAWLIEKASLYEFQEALAEVLHWSA